MYEVIKRYSVFVLGLYFLSLGVVMIISSSLGSTPISSVNYVVSLNSPLSLGTCTFIINMLLIAGQLLLIRGRSTKKDYVEIMLQVPFSFVFGAFIDINMYLASGVHPSNYLMAICLLLAGCVVQAVGVVLEIKPRVAMMSAEAFVKYAADRYDKEFGRFKVGFDVILVTIAVITSIALSGTVEGVREGSVVAATLTGVLVTYINSRIITRRNLD
ncbi:MAG: hypothetical protein K2O12_00720, partial [Muribaculaceae bacterium]|nr:hypothetical protein [Muribaculaceae bacterium]